MLFSEYVLITANAINKQHFHTPLRELYYQLCCLQMSLVILLTDVVFLTLLTTLISIYILLTLISIILRTTVLSIYYSHLFPLYYLQMSFPYPTHTYNRCFFKPKHRWHFLILLTSCCFYRAAYKCHFNILLILVIFTSYSYNYSLSLAFSCTTHSCCVMPFHVTSRIWRTRIEVAMSQILMPMLVRRSL